MEEIRLVLNIIGSLIIFGAFLAFIAFVHYMATGEKPPSGRIIESLYAG